MSTALAIAKALDRRKVIPAMRSAISDGWLPKYRRAVEAAFREEAKEAAERFAAGADIAYLADQWAARQQKVQMPLSLIMAVEGFKLADTELGKRVDLRSMVEGKQVEVVFSDSDALIARKLQPNVEAWLQEVTRAMSQTTLQRAKTIVRNGRAEGLTVGQLTSALRTTLVAYGRPRAEMVARSATIWNYNEGAQESYKESGVAVKEWMVTADDVLCDECAAMDGKQELIGGAFEGGIEHPPLHPSCRCALLPVV